MAAVAVHFSAVLQANANGSCAVETEAEMIDFQYYNSNQKPLYEICYEYLKDAIVCGFICVGEAIGESDYAALLNVSRTPIRTAIKKLENYGIVEVDPVSDATIVKGLGIEGITNVYQMQITLEKLLYPLVLKNITDEDLIHLYKLLSDIEEAVKQKDLVFSSEANARLHRKILMISRFVGVKEVINWVYGLVNGFNLIAFGDADRQRAIFNEHRALVNAMQAKDCTLLLQVASDHTEACMNYSLKHYKLNYNQRVLELNSQRTKKQGHPNLRIL